MRRNILIIMAAALGLLVHPGGRRPGRACAGERPESGGLPGRKRRSRARSRDFGAFRRGDRPRPRGARCGKPRRAAAWRRISRFERRGCWPRSYRKTPRSQGDSHARGRHGDDRRAARLGGELQRRPPCSSPFMRTPPGAPARAGRAIVVAAPRRPPRVAGEAARAVAFRWQRSQNIHLASNRRFALNLQRRFAAIRANEKPPVHILAVRDLEGARMPAAYVSLGVISTPEDEARLSEIGRRGSIPHGARQGGAQVRGPHGRPAAEATHARRRQHRR